MDANINIMNYKYTIAAFDFDDTITRKCTFVGIIVYAKGYLKFLAGMLTLLPDVILYKLGLMSNYLIKKKMFTRFFAGIDIQKYLDLCNDYSLNHIDKLIRKEAQEKIDWHKQKGHNLIIVTASMEDWIKPWAFKNGFKEVISTKPQVKDGVLTGDFETKNCFGNEKVNRLLEKYPDRQEYFLYFYGDSEGDLELLKFADKPLYNFKEVYCR